MLANRTIGLSREYVASNGKVKKQNVGLERSYDTFINWSKRSTTCSLYCRWTAVPVEGYQIEPENGKDVFTTLDVNIQDITETALMKMMMQSEATIWNCNRNGNKNRKDQSDGKSRPADKMEVIGKMIIMHCELPNQVQPSSLQHFYLYLEKGSSNLMIWWK